MSVILPRPIFRFDSVSHRYYANGEERPHLTGLLKAAGLVDDSWFTDSSRVRGQAVHKLTADFDMDALDVPNLVSPYKGYLLGHVSAMAVIPHTWQKIEEPNMHPTWMYGYRADRVGLIYGQQGVLEEKSTAAPHRAHEIQTALQVIGESYDHPVPAEHWWRGALYPKPNGKWTLIQHTNRRDFDEAHRILNRYCPPRPVAEAIEPAEALADRRRHRRDEGSSRHFQDAAPRAASAR